MAKTPQQKLIKAEADLAAAKASGAKGRINIMQNRVDNARKKVNGQETFTERVQRQDATDRVNDYPTILQDPQDVSEQVKNQTQPQTEPEPKYVTPVSNVDTPSPEIYKKLTRHKISTSKIGYNILDNYSSYSYKFKLFMINELDLKKVEGITLDLSSIDKVVIAETGATSFYINSVNFDSKVATNNESLNTITAKFDMNIIEPYGASLFDRMAAAASRLGIRNYAQMPLYLELTFTGYDEYDKPYPDILGDNKKIWQVIIRNTEMTVTEKGSEYTLLGSLINEVGIFKEFGTLPTSMSVSGRTLPKILWALESAWNEAEKKKWAVSQTPKKTYKFVLYNEWRAGEYKIDWSNEEDMKFNSEHIKFSSLRSDNPAARDKDDNLVVSSDGTIKPEFSQGDSVQKIINNLLSATNWAERMGQMIARKATNAAAADDKDRDKVGTNAQESFHSTLSTVNIHPQVIYEDWDPTTNDYNRVIVYHIIPYDAASQLMATLEPEIKEDQYELKKAEIEKSIQEYKGRKNLIKRKYSYIFTGENTDILTFDLRFNNIWQSYVPFYNGATGIDVLNNRHAAIDREKLSEFDQARVDAANARKRAVVSKAKLDKTRNRIIDEQNKLKNKSLDKDEINAINKNINLLNLQKENQERLSIGATEASADAKANAIELARLEEAKRRTYIKNREIYAEDIDPNSLSMIPFSITDTSDGTANASGQPIETRNTIGKNFFNSLLNNQYTAKSRDFMNIDFEIRGDPYWLGKSHIKTESAFLKNLFKFGEESERIMTTADVEIFMQSELDRKKNFVPQVGEQLFLMEFFSPSTNNDRFDGLDKLKYSESISGIWFVQTLKSKFEGGKFTQTIGAKRDPITGQIPYSSIDKKIANLYADHDEVTNNQNKHNEDKIAQAIKLKASNK